MKHSSATGMISSVSGEADDIYGGSIWAMDGIEIPSPDSGSFTSHRTVSAVVNSSLLMDYTLVVAQQIVPDILNPFKIGNMEVSGGSEEAAVISKASTVAFRR